MRDLIVKLSKIIIVNLICYLFNLNGFEEIMLNILVILNIRIYLKADLRIIVS
jgi:hypothetical protein